MSGDLNMAEQQHGTTKKHRDFVAEPLGDKSVDQIPGIGVKLKGYLADKGISKANQIVGYFLFVGKNEVRFKEWFIQQCPADQGQQTNCCNAVKEWCSFYT